VKDKKYVFKQIFEMCKLQDKLNRIIDSNWLNKRTLQDFYVAINQEVAELIDTYPWKWWKKMDDDVDNRLIEIVDIWHFVMSYWMLKFYKGGYVNNYIEAAAKMLSDYYEVSEPIKSKDEFSQVIDLYGIFDPQSRNTILDLVVFFSIVKTYFQDIDSFTKLYFAKNALNILRQEYGYKNGKYQKIINGLEDNRYLLGIIDEIKEFDNFDDFKDKLAAKIISEGDYGQQELERSTSYHKRESQEVSRTS